MHEEPLMHAHARLNVAQKPTAFEDVLLVPLVLFLMLSHPLPPAPNPRTRFSCAELVCSGASLFLSGVYSALLRHCNLYTQIPVMTHGVMI